jgi:hypothetical protein
MHMCSTRVMQSQACKIFFPGDFKKNSNFEKMIFYFLKYYLQNRGIWPF